MNSADIQSITDRIFATSIKDLPDPDNPILMLMQAGDAFSRAVVKDHRRKADKWEAEAIFTYLTFYSVLVNMVGKLKFVDFLQRLEFGREKSILDAKLSGIPEDDSAMWGENKFSTVMLSRGYVTQLLVAHSVLTMSITSEANDIINELLSSPSAARLLCFTSVILGMGAITEVKASSLVYKKDIDMFEYHTTRKDLV